MEIAGAGGAYCIVPRYLLDRLMGAGLGASHLGLLAFLVDRSDRSGLSFWSFRKIASRLSCSKATVSRMLSDLASAGLVSKAPRRRRDGANSIIEVTITGYAEFMGRYQPKTEADADPDTSQPDPVESGPCPIVAKRDEPSAFAASVVSQMKRAVASVKRSGNENQGKPIPTTLPSLPAEPSWSEKHEQEWVRLFGEKTGVHDNPSGSPSPDLLEAAVARAERLKAEQAGGGASARNAWRSMLEAIGVSFSEADVGSLAAATAGLEPDQLHAFLQSYQESWKPYWRRPPTEAQVRKLVSEAGFDTRRSAGKGRIFSEAMSRSLVAARLLRPLRRAQQKEVAA
ncbi:helix-turn-helix domain-containing protein [Tranquillimonas alkanivorans]|uniref:MarR family protein n=1 Tax=Tranquillimonas alkanivorans TaxID=441119 RepID=A0A1I5WD53_9RHOB|nr:helix-turn-helix domain-containing protein [Tranquillimonas alkanivorans]SFQ17256.1 MarR family protein [Tranquillimonas alkanivorans]